MDEENKGFGTWILNHLKTVLAILVFGITGVIIAVVMMNSYNSYQDYEKKFNQNDLELRSLSAAQPKRIEIEDGYKAAYANKLIFDASELNVTTSQAEYLVDDYIDLTEKGGSVSVDLSLEEKSFVDIVFTISSSYETTTGEDTEYGVKDLLSSVSFVVNGETMEDSVDLKNSGNGQEWHKLVMAGFALPAGDVSVVVKAESNKAKMMPQIQSISFYSSEVLTAIEETAEQ